MPRPNRGSIDVRAQVDGAQTFYLRLTVDGRRHRVRLGSNREGWTHGRAMVALEEQLAEIRAGIWQRAELAAGPSAGEENDLTFRAYASSWLEDNMLEWRQSTIRDVKWRLESHLLPHVGEVRLRIYTESLRDRERSQHGKAFDDLLNGSLGRRADTSRVESLR